MKKYIGINFALNISNYLKKVENDMKIYKKIPNDLLLTTDFMNTINGGSVKPNVIFKRIEGMYELKVDVPGIAPEDLQVDVINDKLTVSSLTKTFNMDVMIPKVQAMINIPRDVDFQKIEAFSGGDQLIVYFPFNHDGPGFHKRIDVKQYPGNQWLF
ncbi:Hsp20/alpha crystallin family protein [Marinigracilibium pacificum]|uniref:Hsp20/alpha crystallin family protein n=1 Tax=Marinigracilibium pacificum TaxID=2729599 RepID=A0A848IR45_9BACT|nr:Hsp20/alpha crystallin family protein [Marinigracilibium pacificum]NMM46827.1 Hsp20/alpha crystallin family protein [Marinigracilibium pacificum]